MSRILTMMLLLTATSPSEAETAPSGDRMVSFEFKEITAHNLYKILGEISGRVFVVSHDVGQMKVTLAMSNVPAQVAIETLNRYLNVRARPLAPQDLTFNAKSLVHDSQTNVTVFEGEGSLERGDGSVHAQRFVFNEETREVTADGLAVWFVDSIDENPSKAQAIADLERELEGLKKRVADTERRLASAKARPE